MAEWKSSTDEGSDSATAPVETDAVDDNFVDDGFVDSGDTETIEDFFNASGDDGADEVECINAAAADELFASWGRGHGGRPRRMHS